MQPSVKNALICFAAAIPANNLIGEWELSPEKYVAKDDIIKIKKNLSDKGPSEIPVCGYIDNSIDGAPALYFTKTPKFVKVPNT